MMLHTLTPSEEEVMQLIWKREKTYFRELMEAFPEPKPHQNTVSTFLKILVEKHYLTTEKQGRIYLYSPSINFDDYKKFVLKRFLESYFGNSGAELLKVLVEEKVVTSEDLENYAVGKSKKTAAKENTTEENYIQAFIKEITADKKSKKKDKTAKKKSKKKNK